MNKQDKVSLERAIDILSNLSEQAFGEPLSSSLVDDIKSDAKHDGAWLDEYKYKPGDDCECSKAVESFYACREESNGMDDLLIDSGLNMIADEIHRTACGKGWWEEATLGEDDPFVTDEDLLLLNRSLIAEKLLMIHSEISEATEDLRIAKTMSDLSSVDFMDPSNDQKPTGFAIELADTIIRILDLAAFLEIDIEGALSDKLAFNKSRTYRHGNKNL